MIKIKVNETIKIDAGHVSDAKLADGELAELIKESHETGKVMGDVVYNPVIDTYFWYTRSKWVIADKPIQFNFTTGEWDES